MGLFSVKDMFEGYCDSFYGDLRVFIEFEVSNFEKNCLIIGGYVYIDY